jgi:glycosyltransferase involved in cell wall biosynthesis
MLLEDKLYPFFYRDIPLVTFSESTKRDFVGIGFREPNIIVAPHALAHVMFANSFNTDTIAKRLLSYQEPIEKNGVPMFVCLGRLKKYKGVQDAILAMGEVIKKTPEAKLVILGKGDYQESLLRLVRDHSLAKNVLFLGYVPFEEKLRLIKQSHALIMPSYKEGFPTPILEAHACGTPVVATDAIGISDYVRPGVNGLLYPPGNWRKLAELLSDILENDTLGRLGRSDQAKRFTMDWIENENELVSKVESFFL